jgi:hypothetical protein
MTWPPNGVGICCQCGGWVVLELGRLRCTRCGETWGYRLTAACSSAAIASHDSQPWQSNARGSSSVGVAQSTQHSALHRTHGRDGMP